MAGDTWSSVRLCGRLRFLRGRTSAKEARGASVAAETLREKPSDARHAPLLGRHGQARGRPVVWAKKQNSLGEAAHLQSRPPPKKASAHATRDKARSTATGRA